MSWPLRPGSCPTASTVRTPVELADRERVGELAVLVGRGGHELLAVVAERDLLALGQTGDGDELGLADLHLVLLHLDRDLLGGADHEDVELTGAVRVAAHHLDRVLAVGQVLTGV